MSIVATATRRFAVLAGDTTVDLAAPTGESLGAALEAAGFSLDPQRHALVLRDGSLISPSTPVDAVVDGTLVILIDLATAGTTRDAATGSTRVSARSTWWMLATLSGLLAALGLALLAAGVSVLESGLALAVGGLMGAGAIVTGGLWARRGDDGTGAAPTAALLLAFAAATVAVPAMAGGAQLAIALGLGSAGVLFTALMIASPTGAKRAMAATLATLMVVLAVIWGGTLLWGWGLTAAAALSLGMVAPGWRLLPQLLLTLPDGWSIHYKAFMTSRWTVRGAVPEDPGPVTMPTVRRAVEDAGARLIAGSAVLSAVAVLTTPVLLTHLPDAGTVARIGALVLLATTVLYLLLAPRHATTPALRWLARAAAIGMLVTAAVVVSGTAGEIAPLGIAAGLLLAGAIAAAAIVPIGRGVRSVAWSRTGDAFEAIAVALAPAAALLAADTLEIIRRAMSA